jgi:hypothetical protein
MAKQRKKKKKNKFLDVYDKIRKPMPPPSKVINPKKKYNRKDKSWINDEDE